MAQMIHKEDGTKPILNNRPFVNKEEKDHDQKTYPIMATTVNSDWFIPGGLIKQEGIHLGSLIKAPKKDDDSRNDKVDNKGKDIITAEKEQFTIANAYWITDLQEGSNTADAKRIKVSQKSMDSAITLNGGFKDITRVDGIKNVKIEQR